MLKKYEFADIEDFQQKTNGIETTNKPIILGYKIIEIGEYDENGDEIKAPVMGDKLMVDIYWESHEDSSVLDAFEIFPNNPIHKIFGT